jgi:excisionase family DNA binding protein
MSAPSILMSIKTAAKETDLSEYTIRKAINENKLKAIKVGSVLRLRPADVEEWVAGHDGGAE